MTVGNSYYLNDGDTVRNNVYNETNPAPLNWVYDEDNGTYAADMKELDSAVDANKV